MNIATEAAKLAISRAALPWLIGVAIMVLSSTGLTGMYLGALVERGRHAGEVQALKDEQLATLKQSSKALTQAIVRGDDVSNRFFTALTNIRIENKTFVTKSRLEVEKQVYIDCKLPDSGADLLASQVEAVNARMLSLSPPAKGTP